MESFYFQSDTDGSRRNSIVDRRQSVINPSTGVNILNNNDLADTSSSSLHTLIFHGLQEDWMELNMETLEKKQMVLELNVRKVKIKTKSKDILSVDRKGFSGCSSKARV